MTRLGSCVPYGDESSSLFEDDPLSGLLANDDRALSLSNPSNDGTPTNRAML